MTKKLLDENRGSKDNIYTTYKLLKGKLLFHNRRYRGTATYFSLYLPLETLGMPQPCETDFEADCYHWRGKARIKLDTREEFQKGLADLNKAKIFYNDKGDMDSVNEINSHLVVAYAHINEYEQAKVCYEQAEAYFLKTNKDDLKGNKLLRRCVLFFEHANSARILKTSGTTLKNRGYLAEAIMSYNNSATEHMFIHEFK
ncbi:MAG: hypothetical protein LUD02_05515 [Tannerellaceae bacterium]|nr:hypothetical protein [Tannerellaceae bacterium]MCD8263671.1 hypothetical protein [Tannerellaceae bacterium]